MEGVMTEEWRTILLGKLSIKSQYEVSNIGSVRNRRTGRIIKSYHVINRSGDLYKKVDLYLEGTRYKHFVHRLVAAAFHPNLEHKPEVNHWDEDTLHNEATNLEWATREEQERHKIFMKALA
jgi:hypothetical protein